MKASPKADDRKDGAQHPASALGRRLRKLRKRIEASGQKLLTMEQIEKEVLHRRGGMDLGRG